MCLATISTEGVCVCVCCCCCCCIYLRFSRMLAVALIETMIVASGPERLSTLSHKNIQSIITRIVGSLWSFYWFSCPTFLTVPCKNVQIRMHNHTAPPMTRLYTRDPSIIVTIFNLSRMRCSYMNDIRLDKL